MANRKYALLMLLASFALTLGACNDKKPASSSEETPASSSQAEQKTVSSISVKDGTSLKTNYAVGDTFSVDGGKLVVNYSDHTRAEVDMTLNMVTNAPDMSVPHENYQVNISYEGKTASYVIQVVSSKENVTLTVTYDYNDSDPAAMADGKLFYEGKSYHFFTAHIPACTSIFYALTVAKDHGSSLCPNFGTDF